MAEAHLAELKSGPRAEESLPRRVRLTSGSEAALVMAGAGLTWLLALAALPVILIGNWLLVASLAGQSDSPVESLVVVIVYDLALGWALLVSRRQARSRASVMFLAFTLAPAAVIGAITLADRIAVERSHTVIH